jgi:hypothetical protein
METLRGMPKNTVDLHTQGITLKDKSYVKLKLFSTTLLWRAAVSSLKPFSKVCACQFEITKQWKGAPSKSTVVITRLTGEACGFPFEEKKEYLVFVVTEPKDIQTGICTGTKNIGEAEQAMKQLDRLLESR